MVEGLTLRQVQFALGVAERPTDSATSIAISAGYSPSSACESARNNLNNPLVVRAIEDRREQLAAAAGLTRERVLREFMSIAFADPSELVRVIVRRCYNCWSLADKELPPNPDCKFCDGDGLRSVWIADTKKLPAAVRKLYAGAVQKKDGIEIKMRDQDAALRFLAEYLGLGKKLEVSGPGGGPIPLAHATVRDLSDEQLEAIIAAGSANLGVAAGVYAAGALPSNTIDATLETV